MNSATADNFSSPSHPGQSIDWSARVEQEWRQALSNLNSSAEGASLCSLHGERVNRAKYHEGQVAALSELIRAMRREGPDPADRLVNQVGAIRERWHGRAAQATAASETWQSYLTGGLDALEQVAGSN